MRYYSIVIDGQVAYTTHPSGPSGPVNPGALWVRMDIPVGPSHIPMGGAYVEISGIGIQAISQAASLTGKSIQVYGGMGVGLPLATLQAPNAGLLVQGTIYPGYGNWLGTDQSISLLISPGPPGYEGNPANLVVTHKQGDKLGDVVKTALTTAYPGYTVNVNVSDSLVLDHPGAGFYQSMEQFAKTVNQMSLSIFGGGQFAQNVLPYRGIQISTTGKTITVDDGTKQTASPTAIQFYDYIGQPTWIGFNEIQVKTIMRGDIQVGDHVTLANTATQTSATSFSQLRDNSIFQGTFQVQKIRHVGNSLQPDGESWVSNFDLVSDGGSQPGQTIGASGTTPSGFVAGPN